VDYFISVLYFITTILPEYSLILLFVQVTMLHIGRVLGGEHAITVTTMCFIVDIYLLALASIISSAHDVRLTYTLSDFEKKGTLQYLAHVKCKASIYGCHVSSYTMTVACSHRVYNIILLILHIDCCLIISRKPL